MFGEIWDGQRKPEGGLERELPGSVADTRGPRHAPDAHDHELNSPHPVRTNGRPLHIVQEAGRPM